MASEIETLKKNLDDFDTGYHLTQKLKLLGEDLDKATDIINSEMEQVSSKISTEFSQLINSLTNELDQITIKVSTTSYHNESNTTHFGLSEAVRKAGISVKKY